MWSLSTSKLVIFLIQNYIIIVKTTFVHMYICKYILMHLHYVLSAATICYILLPDKKRPFGSKFSDFS